MKNNNTYFPLSYDMPIMYAEGGWFKPADSNYGNPVTGMDILGGAGKGAALGAKLGTVVPGVGNVVGGAIGAVAGASMQLGEWYGNTKLGQTKLGALAGGGLLGPTGLIGRIRGNKKREAFEQEQAKLQEEKRVAWDDKITPLLNMGTLSNSNMPMAMGGMMNSLEGQVGDFTSFENGGTHEQNPYGGIMLGKNNTGRMVSVEEGESRFKFPEGDYIFSNRLTY